VLCNYLEVVIGKLVLIMLVLGSFHLILVGVLGVLVEVRLAFAIYSDLKQLSAFIVGPAGSNRVFNCLESLVNACKSVEIGTFDARLEGSFLKIKTNKRGK
jgi:hypothetical protein